MQGEYRFGPEARGLDPHGSFPAGGLGRPRERGQHQVAEKTSQTIYIEADPGTVMDVIADIDSYPQWISEYREAEVQETDADGNPKVARVVLDAAVLKDTLVMSYEWPKDRQSVSWTLVSSSLLRSLEGTYRLAPKGSGTEVTYELTVDLAVPMIGLLKRKAERRLTDTALKDLKKRVEG
ncbi:polyketide cyclase/dehydrase [Mycobacterium parascrofulaceum ATCC BAA-614]|uniref:Polyketide cyclase/dehydrase n=1 Tax=Mycobacterium parascrofulaceum ATCC BAA-614 TaxID=525368 RepID=D5P6Z5_9MYCO|nr:polyketide cyclase/dehydrase [Mycobacterium parascrofulaceum ATCC BAA-614]